MSWTDPCRNGCGGTKADCFCEDFDLWNTELEKEKEHYPIFRGRELCLTQLKELWRQHKSPIDALNDLSTLA